MLFRAKPDWGAAPPRRRRSPPAIFFISSRKNSRDDVLPGATYFCIFCRRPYAIGNACVFHQMRMELYHQDRLERVPIADRLKNEPVSQCSSNTLPGLAIAVSLLLTLCCKLLLGNGLTSFKKSSKAKNLHSACVDTGHQAGSETTPAPHKT